MNIEIFKEKLEKAFNEINTQGVITELVKSYINHINKSDLVNYLLISEKNDEKTFRMLSNITPWIAETIWQSIDSETTNEQKLSIFKKNALFNNVNKKNIEVLKQIMKIDVSLFVYEKNGNNIFFELLNEDIDLTFIKDEKANINKLSYDQKNEILRKICNSAGYISNKKRADVIEIITNVDNWYMNKNAYVNVVRISKNSHVKYLSHKISAILYNALNKESFEYLNKQGMNIIHDFMENGFDINTKLIKSCIKHQPLNVSKNKDILPIFVKMEQALFNENIEKNFEQLKNYYGMNNFIGNKSDQEIIVERLLSDNHLYKRYHTLFSGNGKPSSFVKLLQKLGNEKSLSLNLKRIADILCLSADENFMENAKASDVIEKIKVMDIDLIGKLIKSNIFNVLLVNMKDKSIAENIEEQVTVIKQKELLKNSILVISPNLTVKNRI